MKDELSIVIPTKNEEKYIGKLLNSLSQQTYPIKDTEIFIADANSTDNTRRIVNEYSNRFNMNIKIINGGLPAVGRNNGAKQSNSKYILFLDADVVLGWNNLIEKTIDIANKKNKDLITVSLYCPDKNYFAKFLYSITNILVRLSKYINCPFATGMYFFIRRTEYEKHGGFPEDFGFAEDYALSKKISGCKFKVIPGHIKVTDRRFKTTGYLQMITLFLTTMIFPLKTKTNFDYWKNPHE